MGGIKYKSVKLHIINFSRQRIASYKLSVVKYSGLITRNLMVSITLLILIKHHINFF